MVPGLKMIYSTVRAFILTSMATNTKVRFRMTCSMDRDAIAMPMVTNMLVNTRKALNMVEALIPI